MTLKGLALLAADTARSKAYLQAMVKKNLLPEICIVYSDGIDSMEREAENYRLPNTTSEYFDIDQPVLWTLKAAGIKFMLVHDRDINADAICAAVGGLEQDYIVYSGYGAALLKHEILSLGKRFIHIHAGILPRYRGSTTAYYSWLEEGRLGATAIFISEGIDEGEMILQKSFDPPRACVNVDVVFEPWTRSELLIEVLERYARDGELSTMRQSESDARTYYIIHPVLKHIALLKMEQ